MSFISMLNFATETPHQWTLLVVGSTRVETYSRVQYNIASNMQTMRNPSLQQEEMIDLNTLM
eukprot:scaffold27009_cov194-Skeletonema_menzelii.AAC.1